MSSPRDAEHAHLHHVGRGGTQNLIAAVAASAIGIVTSVIMARLLSKVDLGNFFTATSLVILLAAVARLGTSVSLVYWVSRLRELGHSRQIPTLLRIAFGPVIVLSVIASVLMYVTAPELSDSLFGGQPDAVGLVRVLAVFTPFVVLFDALLGATRGFGAMGPTALIDRLTRPLAQLILIVVAGSVAGLVAVAAAWAAPYLLATIAAGWWLLRRLRKEDTQSGAEIPGLRASFWHYTWPRAISSVVQQFRQRLDLILVAALSSPMETALYGVASRFLVVGQLTNSALGLAAQPQVASLNAADRHEAVQSVYRTTTMWIILVNGPLYLVVAVFSPLLLSIFGQEYVSAWPVTFVLCVAAFIGNGSGMVDVMLSMTGRTRWTLFNAVGALVVQIGIDVVLIPSKGAMGAAIGWAASIVVINALSVLQLAVQDQLHPFGRGTTQAVVVNLIAVALPSLAALLIFGQTWLALLVALVIGGALYLALVWRMRQLFQVDLLVASLRRSR
jgi:O-antigen/teichoic acid export membrane protein